MNHQIPFGHTGLQDDGGGNTQSPPSVNRYEFVAKHDENQLATAATTIAGNLAREAKFGPPAAYQDPDSFATAISDRGMGFRDPHLRASVPSYASVAIRNSIALITRARWRFAAVGI